VAENKLNTAKEAEAMHKEVVKNLVENTTDDPVEDLKLDCIYDDEP